MQLGKQKSVTVENLALCSESISFLLGELPHIKGRIELVLQAEKKDSIEETITVLRSALISHRDSIYGKISFILSSR